MYKSTNTELFDEMADKVAALSRPSTYDEPTAKVETVETHMAWVFLTDRRAYKLKKPIRTEYFDHTTVEARRRASSTELKLNRRLAPQVYRSVTPVVSLHGGYTVGADGPVVDWVLEMTRLPRRQTLERTIERRAVTPADIDAVATRLSTFYRQATPADLTGPEYRRRIAEDIETKRTSLSAPRYELEQHHIRDAASRLQGWLRAHHQILEARSHRVVDAHGDLRPEHVFLLDDGPVFIDCLDFDRSLRLLDPVSELSFLSLESARLGADWLETRLVDTYSHETDDEPPPGLVAFYKSYHALVRAAVAIWHIDDQLLDDAPHWRRKATDYLGEIPHFL